MEAFQTLWMLLQVEENISRDIHGYKTSPFQLIKLREYENHGTSKATAIYMVRITYWE